MSDIVDRVINLGHLKDACKDCRSCNLSIGRTNVVFARGNPYSQIVVVGEAPGADEDASGLPFVGRAGQLLDKMFASVGIDTNADLYLTNTVRCRPPGNRVPTPEETRACSSWLYDTLDLIQPRFIITVGATALQWFLQRDVKITQERGKWVRWSAPSYSFAKVECSLIPILHPAYLLRQEADWSNANSPHSLTYRDMKAIAHARSSGTQLPASSSEFDS